LEPHERDLAVAPYQQHGLQRKLETLEPVLGEVDPHELSACFLLELVDLVRGDDVFVRCVIRSIEIVEGTEVGAG
jgi:hypothetical protein